MTPSRTATPSGRGRQRNTSPRSTSRRPAGRGARTAPAGRGSSAVAARPLRLRALPLVLGTLCLLLSVIGLARIAVVLVGPPPRIVDRQRQQAFLESSIAGGGDDRMQSLFPEGYYFMHVLTGTSGARLTVDPSTLDRARAHLAAIESPRGIGPFGDQMVPEHGVFTAGWSLGLAVDIAISSRSAPDLAKVRARVGPVAAALVGSRGGSPFLASYPGQFWPCDSVVAAANLARAGDLLGRQDLIDAATDWSRRAMGYADPATGLLPHRVDAGGAALDGPRGSSQAIIAYHWPELSRDPRLWRLFCDTFIERRGPLVGIREFPRGNDSPGDVDSGPLLAGVSLSASAVTLGAARRWGDAHLTQTLTQQAELFGAPVTLPGRRAYALGAMPAGDAFLLWSQSAPMAGDGPNAQAPEPRWGLLTLLTAIPGLLGLALIAWALRARSRLRRVVAKGRSASRTRSTGRGTPARSSRPTRPGGRPAARPGAQRGAGRDRTKRTN